MTRRILMVLAALAAGSMATGAQDILIPADGTSQVFQRGLGSQVFEIDLGLGIPLFSFPNESGGITPGANLKIGGTGALKWSSFVNESLAIGADVSGMIVPGPNDYTLAIFPLGVRVSNFFRINRDFQIPVHFTTALNLMRYKDLSYVGLALKPGFSVYWDATKDWSFGLNFVYWFLPEWYTDPNGTPPSTQTRYGNILEVTLSALYNF